MLRVNQIKIRPGQGEREILRKAAGLLKVNESEIAGLEIQRRSIDARKKPEIFYSYTVDITLKNASLESGICKRLGPAQVSRVTERAYRFPHSGDTLMEHPPVIVGMGPAGLFCAYYLALHGYRPIVLERGRDVDRRREDVQRFWDGGPLDPQSNVQFGEGAQAPFPTGN